MVRLSSGTRPDNDWNGWKQIAPVHAICSDNELETQTYLNSNTDVHARVHLVDFNNNYDLSDIVFGSESGALLIYQHTIAPTVMEDIDESSGLPGLLELKLQAYCSDIRVDKIDFNHDVNVFDGANRVIFPLTVEESTPKIITVKPKDPQRGLTTGETFTLETMAAKVDRGAVTITGSGAKSYIGTVTHEIKIDGLFEDWVGIEKVSDSDSQPVSNPNVDISSYAAVNTDSVLSLYLDVEGAILEGTELPVEAYVYQPRTPGEQPGSMNVGTNAKHPLTDLPIRTGEDSLYIFLDTDNNGCTGYHPDEQFRIGADYMVEITGQNREIIERNLKEFKGSSQSDFNWLDLIEIPAACSGSELEAQLNFDLDLIYQQKNPKIDIYVHIVDWLGECDHAGELRVDTECSDTDKLVVRNSLTRYDSNTIINTYRDAGFGQPTTEFKHDEVVYVTVTNGMSAGGVKTVMIMDNDDGSKDKISVQIYDDGTHADKQANDGLYSGRFKLQSMEKGGITDNDMDTIAVKKAVHIYPELRDNDDSKYLSIPEFGSSIFILLICCTLLLIALISRKKEVI